ncbi:competence type IV pilus minor pilin ComGD [Companilactobacillus sp. RD055328]|uniref:competence type IV pilus minor pilin ComGD n=1 Tax=Companilactobacillus sp. RD055328 TaxID=2916634 RepID=UPI001FC83B4B|nr:competence type IV pilus minor pilin ComGD [Companilactobacillus sp. RD055328]
MRKENKAFTLLEMVIALVIITMFLLIPLSSYNKIENNLQKVIFFNEVKTAWSYSLIQSKIHHDNVRFKFDASNQLIIYDQIGSNDKKKMSLPKGIHLETTRSVVIDRDGTVRPFTIAFYDTDTQKLIKYKIQMEWGEIIES